MREKIYTPKKAISGLTRRSTSKKKEKKKKLHSQKQKDTFQNNSNIKVGRKEIPKEDLHREMVIKKPSFICPDPSGSKLGTGFTVTEFEESHTTSNMEIFSQNF